MSTPTALFVEARFKEADPLARLQMLEMLTDQLTTVEARALLEKLMELLHLPGWVRKIVRIFVKGVAAS